MTKKTLMVAVLLFAVALFFSPAPSFAVNDRIDSFTWIGKDADKVGEWGHGKPDGRPDGHFKLKMTVPTQRNIASIAIYSSTDLAVPTGGQVWHTQNTSNWILGVVYLGSQINSGHLATLGKFSGNLEFDLYGSDSGWFKNGQAFVVEVTFGNGEKMTKLTKVVAGKHTGQQQQTASTPSSGAINSFIWVGKDSDKVGEWSNGKPDGKVDGHFRLQMSLPAARNIASIAIYSANDAGVPTGGQVWHTLNTSNWVLGVVYQGAQINLSHVQTLGKFSGNLEFDLYGSDSGWFNNGQPFLVEVTFGNGEKMTMLTKVTGKQKQSQGFSTPQPSYGSPAQHDSLSGEWTSSESGSMTIFQSGSKFSATYPLKNGRIIGTLYGNTLEGNWVQDSSGRRCSTPVDNSYYWGRIKLNFTSKSYSGYWGYCNDNPNAGWNGTRK